MIKLTDLRVKLAPNESKIVKDENGLYLEIRGNIKGTSYYFKHRCTYNGKRILFTIKTNDLKEARKIALDRMQKVLNGIHPDNQLIIGELTLKQAIDDYMHIKANKVQSNTLKRSEILINKHFSNFFNFPIHQLNAKKIYTDIFQELIQEQKFNTLQKASNILINAYDLASVNYPTEQIPNIKGLRQMLPTGIVKHMASITDGDIRKNITQIKNIAYSSTNIIIHYLFDLSILLLLRQQEITEIKLSDIDFDNKILTIPKTKTMQGFRVPLSKQALKVINQLIILKRHKDNEYLIESRIHKFDHVNSSTLNTHFKRNGLKGLQTAHGLRAIGRTWLEQQDIKFEVAEACLSHFVGSNTVKAYRRTDYLEERKEVMQKWSDFLESI